MTIESLELSSETFLFSNIENLNWKKQSIKLYSTDLGLDSFSITMHTDVNGWIALKNNRLFNYSHEICGPILGGGFNPSKDYIITVVMHSEKLALLSILYDAESLEAWLASKQVQTICADHNNFLLVTVMQQITPKTQWGMSTKYDETHHPK